MGFDQDSFMQKTPPPGWASLHARRRGHERRQLREAGPLDTERLLLNRGKAGNMGLTLYAYINIYIYIYWCDLVIYIYIYVYVFIGSII